MITQTEYQQIKQFIKILGDVVETTAASMDHLNELVSRIEFTEDMTGEQEEPVNA